MTTVATRLKFYLPIKIPALSHMARKSRLYGLTTVSLPGPGITNLQLYFYVSLNASSPQETTNLTCVQEESSPQESREIFTYTKQHTFNYSPPVVVRLRIFPYRFCLEY